MTQYLLTRRVIRPMLNRMNINTFKARVQTLADQFAAFWRFEFQLPLLSEEEVLEELQSNAS